MTGRPLQSAQYRDTVYHEAGHAVVAGILGIRITGIAVSRKRGYSWVDTRIGKTDIRDVVVAMAGGAAESLMYPRRRNHHDYGDYKTACGYARRFGLRGRHVIDYVMSQHEIAKMLLDQNWRAVERVAGRLLEKGVWFEDADAMVREHLGKTVAR